MPEYQVTVAGPDLQMSRKVGQDVALGVLAVLMRNEGPASRNDLGFGRRHLADAPNIPDHEPAIGEFVAGLNITSNAERIAAIALYMSELQGERLVPKDDLPLWFQRSGEAAPKNLARDLKVAVSRRLVSEDHARAGYYFVTKTGIDQLRRSPTAQVSASEPGGTSLRASNPPASRAKPAPLGKKPARRNATVAGKGPTERILELKEAGWLSAPKTLQDIISELSRRGAHYKRTDLTRLVQTLIQRGDLARTKKAVNAGGREVWHYSAED